MLTRSFRIGTRIGISFLMILSIMIAVVIASNVISQKNNSNLISGLTKIHEKVILATNLKTLMLESGVAIRNLGLQSEVTEMQKEVTKAKEKAKEYAQIRTRLLATGLSEEEKKRLENLVRIEGEIDKAFTEALGHALAFNSEGAAKTISGRIEPATRLAIVEIDKLIDMQNASADAIMGEVQSEGKKAVYVFLAISALTVCIATWLVLILRNSITVPLKYAVEIAEKVASGELLGNIKTEGKDEISVLLQALKDMNGSLLGIVSEVRQRTAAISMISQGIFEGNNDLSLRTQTQAGSLQQTAAAVEQLTVTVQKNADSLETANCMVGSTAECAEQGKKIFGDVIQTMGAIQNSSRLIFDITSVIDSIAFQTNILALNAAVEAARAGEEGRGFAVVANEVRQLAQRSAAAAKEIKDLIKNSFDKIQDGSQLVANAGTAMDKIVESVSNVSTIFGEIRHASHEQNAGIREVSQSVTQIDKMTQLNADMVERAAAAARDMQVEMGWLLESVSAFEFEEADTEEAKIGNMQLLECRV